MQKATGVSIGQLASRVVQRRAEASTREPIDGCRMAIGPLDCVEAIVLHACFFDWINHGEVPLAATLRAAKGLVPIVDVLKAADVQWGIPEHTAVQRRSAYLASDSEEAAEPISLGAKGPLGTSDLVVIVEESGSKRLNRRLATATQVIVSFAILGAVFYVIVCKQYASNDTKWAYGIVGTVIGYWLKGR